MKKDPVQLFDNTRISAFKRCPRYFYYRHEKSWIFDGRMPPALAFGQSWHSAMDTLWALVKAPGKKHELDLCISMAMESFEATWSECGYPTEGGDNFGIDMRDLEPRTPAIAHEMLYGYVAARRNIFQSSELIAIEKPFMVPISTDLSVLYVGKLDKLIKFENGISVVEHKTSSNYRKATGINPAQLDSYSPNSQIDGYLHALHMLYGEKAGYVLADVALVHKTVHDAFAMQPIRKLPNKMDEFLTDTRYWIGQIKLARETGYFPKNTNSCFDFNQQCPYTELCRGRNFEQVKQQEDPPMGMKVEVWDPVDVLKINLEKLNDYLVE